MRFVLAFAFIMLLAGCEKPVPTKSSSPSLESTNPKERAEAARRAADQFGGTRP